MLNQLTSPLYQKLVSEFETSGNYVNGELSALRKDAFELFKSKGFPTQRDEEWKFTNLTPFLTQDYGFQKTELTEDHLREAVQNALIADLDAYTLVLLNGKIQAGLSLLPNAEQVTVDTLDKITGTAIYNEYVTLGESDQNAMLALNTAMFKDGYFFEVKKGVVLDKPVQVISIFTADDHAIFQPRNLVIVNEFANAELIETSVVLHDTNHLFVNSVSTMVVKENAQLVQYKIQNNETSERLLSYNQIFQSQNSRYDNFTFCLPGAELIRNNLHVVLNGSATETHLMGLYLVGDHQLTDNHTAIHHKFPHCESNEVYKGVLLNNGKAVFNGKVFVERAAQKTNAFQQNNNLLLSDKAQVFAKPQLEIFADDVKCSHGCTVGQFDPESLFYLRSRGISEASSRKLLVEAFMFDVTEKISNEALKQYVQNLIYSKMENSFISIA